MSEAPATEGIRVTLSVDGRVVFSRIDLIDSAERDAIYATKERGIASYSASLRGDQSEATRIEIVVNGTEHISKWSLVVPVQDTDDALLKLTAALNKDAADVVGGNALIEPLPSTTTTEPNRPAPCEAPGHARGRPPPGGPPRSKPIAPR